MNTLITGRAGFIGSHLAQIIEHHRVQPIEYG